MSGEPSSGETKLLNKAIVGLGVVCAGLVVGGLFVHGHHHFEWEGWFAFSAIFGFLSYAFIVYAGRALRAIVMRGEDYYE